MKKSKKVVTHILMPKEIDQSTDNLMKFFVLLYKVDQRIKQKAIETGKQDKNLPIDIERY